MLGGTWHPATATCPHSSSVPHIAGHLLPPPATQNTWHTAPPPRRRKERDLYCTRRGRSWQPEATCRGPHPDRWRKVPECDVPNSRTSLASHSEKHRALRSPQSIFLFHATLRRVLVPKRQCRTSKLNRALASSQGAGYVKTIVNARRHFSPVQATCLRRLSSSADFQAL